MQFISGVKVVHRWAGQEKNDLCAAFSCLIRKKDPVHPEVDGIFFCLYSKKGLSGAARRNAKANHMNQNDPAVQT